MARRCACAPSASSDTRWRNTSRAWNWSKASIISAAARAAIGKTTATAGGPGFEQTTSPRPRSRRADALRALAHGARYRRDPDEMLRHLLRLQGLSRSPGGPSDQNLATGRMGAARGAVRRLWHRDEHPPISGLRQRVPGLRGTVQSRLPPPSSFLFRDGAGALSQRAIPVTPP